MDIETGRHTYAYDGELEKNYQVKIMTGLPAAGKTSRIVDPDSEAMKAFILDNDMIKKLTTPLFIKVPLVNSSGAFLSLWEISAKSLFYRRNNKKILDEFKRNDNIYYRKCQKNNVSK